MEDYRLKGTQRIHSYRGLLVVIRYHIFFIILMYVSDSLSRTMILFLVGVQPLATAMFGVPFPLLAQQLKTRWSVGFDLLSGAEELRLSRRLPGLWPAGPTGPEP